MPLHSNQVRALRLCRSKPARGRDFSDKEKCSEMSFALSNELRLASAISSNALFEVVVDLKNCWIPFNSYGKSSANNFKIR